MTPLEALRPTRWKTIIFIIVLVLWFMLQDYSARYGPVCDCRVIKDLTCTNYYRYLAIPMSCQCGCTQLSVVTNQYFILLLPGIITYLIYSIAQYIRNRESNLT
jgi:type III secretory pathway component EscU